MFRYFLQRSFADANVNFLTNVTDIAFIAPIMLQELHQYRFQRRHLAREPGIQLRRCSQRNKLERAG